MTEFDFDELDIIWEESKTKAKELSDYKVSYAEKLLGSRPDFKVMDSSQMVETFKSEYKRQNNQDFQITPQHQEIMYQLVYYFSGDDRFKGDLNKGIIIQGPVGSGKTSMLKAFQMIGRIGFGFIKCVDIEAKFDKGGFEEVSRYSEVGKDYLNRVNGWLFDDLGTETEGKNYGKTANVMERILSSIEANNSYGSVFCTTNLSIDGLREFYGDRLVSRFKSMFNQIAFSPEAKDMRI